MDEAKPIRIVPSPLNNVLAPVHRRFKPGISGNPRGREAIGLSWLEWINTLATWQECEVRKVAKNKRAPIVQRAAAKELLRWMTDKTTRAGLPIANDVANRILDRTIGKSTQNINVHRSLESTPEFAEASAMTIEQLRQAAAMFEKFGARPPIAPPSLPAPTPAEAGGKE